MSQLGAQPGLAMQELELRILKLEANIEKMQTFLCNLFKTSLTSTITGQEEVKQEIVCAATKRDQGTQTEDIPSQQTEAHHLLLSEAVAKPSYSGRSTFFTAAEFIRRYNVYIELVFGIVSDHFKLVFVPQCLSGPAKLWYRALSYQFSDWKTFTDMFLRHFWSQHEQHSFRHQISFGCYQPKSKKSRMSEYFLLFVNKTQRMYSPPMEAEFVKCLSAHFPPNVAKRLTGIRNILEAYEVLLDEDRNVDYVTKLDQRRARDEGFVTNCLSSKALDSSSAGGCNGPP